MGATADVIIIGSGIVGNSTAYYLAKKGLSVIVLEKSKHIGDGGSSRNGGGVRQSGRDPRELPLAMYAVEYLWPTLSDELEVDVEYYQEGNLRLGKTAEHLDTLRGIVDSGSSLGLQLSMIDGRTVREICPYMSKEVIGASWCPSDGHANPLRTTLGYYRKARRLGVRFVTEQEVIRIKKIKGRARRVVTADDSYEGSTIVLAAGYESRAVARTVGIDIPMSRWLLETLVTEAQPPMFYQMLGTAGADFYGHQAKHGSFVLGGTSGLEGVNKDNGTPVTSSLTTASICRGVVGYIPDLRDAKVVRTWAGWIDLSVDKVPVISFVEEVPGLILACGFTGHGFGIGPTVGVLVSQMAAGEDPALDIGAFRYDRFAAKS